MTSQIVGKPILVPYSIHKCDVEASSAHTLRINFIEVGDNLCLLSRCHFKDEVITLFAKTCQTHMKEFVCVPDYMCEGDL